MTVDLDEVECKTNDTQEGPAKVIQRGEPIVCSVRGFNLHAKVKIKNFCMDDEASYPDKVEREIATFRCGRSAARVGDVIEIFDAANQGRTFKYTLP